MPNKYTEDFFEHTKMTFGEHLEELRRSLWKAVLALVVGFLIGLWFGYDVVELITLPLTEALEDYYLAGDVEKLAAVLARRDGRESPNDADLAASSKIILDEQKTVELKFLARSEAVQLFANLFPGLQHQIERQNSESTAADDRGPWIPLLIYTNVENDIRTRLQSLGVQEPFMVYIKASLVFGAIVSSPFVFYFVWQFVAAGLYPHEKSYVYVFGPFSLALFLAGAALAFFAVIGLVLDFLFTFNAAMGIDPDPRISEWLSFVLLLPIGFGLSFQLPLVMLFMERIGIVSVQLFIDKWRIAVLIISILSMVLTPADPGSMILMFVPLTILYFGGILLCRLWPKRKSPFGEEIE